MGQRRGFIVTEESDGTPPVKRLVLLDEHGTRITESAPFVAQQERGNYDFFAVQARKQGWMIAREPDTVHPEKRGPNITALWIVTLIVVIALFLVCVVLVLTTTLTIGPA